MSLLSKVRLCNLPSAKQNISSGFARVDETVSYLTLAGGQDMEAMEKQALKEKLAEKGVGLEEAAEKLNVPEQIIALYLKEDSNPVPKRIVDGLNKLLE